MQEEQGKGLWVHHGLSGRSLRLPCTPGSSVLPAGGVCTTQLHPHFSPQVTLSSLFQGLDVGFLQPTSLTLLYPLGAPSNSTDVSLEPMEIATFRLRLG